ncbi:hypothetical protein N658DRAFT_10573 [Parathielavia hyrcaniae]|uniref:Uncharacterized protein n=1 Tax=Parathielavia hyrcaniae TaxID=113614 RepID=A0AAN6Q9R9_9PEZI|nr:hypothetical protein N658DRAFT_10573 [Parathielavia hyrcaniae]
MKGRKEQSRKEANDSTRRNGGAGVHDCMCSFPMSECLPAPFPARGTVAELHPSTKHSRRPRQERVETCIAGEMQHAAALSERGGWKRGAAALHRTGQAPNQPTRSSVLCKYNTVSQCIRGTEISSRADRVLLHQRSSTSLTCWVAYPRVTQASSSGSSNPPHRRA